MLRLEPWNRTLLVLIGVGGFLSGAVLALVREPEKQSAELGRQG